MSSIRQLFLLMCTLVVLTMLSSACDREGSSHVTIRYPAVEGAPNIQRVRVLWGGDKFPTETLRPGESLEGVMRPMNDGSKAITVLVWVRGKQESWDGHIDLGPVEDGSAPYEYEVDIELGPSGTIKMQKCRAPCKLDMNGAR